MFQLNQSIFTRMSSFPIFPDLSYSTPTCHMCTPLYKRPSPNVYFISFSFLLGYFNNTGILNQRVILELHYSTDKCRYWIFPDLFHHVVASITNAASETGTACGETKELFLFHSFWLILGLRNGSTDYRLKISSRRQYRSTAAASVRVGLFGARFTFPEGLPGLVVILFKLVWC